MLVVDVSHGGLCPAPLSRTGVRRALQAMLERAGLRHARVEVVLVRDAAMCQANAHFMGCVGPTNVLSFPEDVACDPLYDKKNTSEGVLAGSLLLSLDTLTREARLFGKTPEAHALFLLAHALGHLAGYEHGEEMDQFCANML